MKAELQKVADFVAKHDSIVILQADNPDGDSLASSLALEQILSDLGKQPIMVCGVDMPTYLRYLAGWDRVQTEFPSKFDATVIVDTSSLTLFESLSKSNQMSTLKSKPCLVIDHHQVTSEIPFAEFTFNADAVATGEAIYEITRANDWPINLTAGEMLATSILSDSLGLMSEATTARSISIIAELVTQGVSLAKLDAMRRSLMRKSPEILAYKGRLLERVEYFDDGRIATITIPWEEIEKYSAQYNPSMLVIDDMRMVEGVDVAIAFKTYPDGKITAKIRCNYQRDIAADLAQRFGGGGHPYASGFKVTSGKPFDMLHHEVITQASKLLDANRANQT